jgi:hypothetical protein
VRGTRRSSKEYFTSEASTSARANPEHKHGQSHERFRCISYMSIGQIMGMGKGHGMRAFVVHRQSMGRGQGMGTGKGHGKRACAI